MFLMNLLITKLWAMPSKNTFQIKPIKFFVENYTCKAKTIIDPFANESTYGTITNDLNPEYNTTYHLDALDFLRTLPDESADLVLYDPPFSSRQVSECYKGFGIEVTSETTSAAWRAKHLDEIARIVKPNGKVLSFGWNTNGVGKKRGFTQIEILIVSHGGSRNDTLCVAEVKD